MSIHVIQDLYYVLHDYYSCEVRDSFLPLPQRH